MNCSKYAMPYLLQIISAFDDSKTTANMQTIQKRMQIWTLSNLTDGGVFIWSFDKETTRRATHSFGHEHKVHGFVAHDITKGHIHSFAHACCLPQCNYNVRKMCPTKKLVAATMNITDMNGLAAARVLHMKYVAPCGLTEHAKMCFALWGQCDDNKPFCMNFPTR